MSVATSPDGFVVVPPGDPRTRPLLEGLHREYVARYGPSIGAEEMEHHPVDEFRAPTGGLVLLLEGGLTVAGGAFRRHDDVTAELKRIWTDPAHRRRGYSRRVLAELERLAAAAGYRRIYLTTGNRQPEASALYRSTGYVPLPGVAHSYTDGVYDVGFEKHLR
ncbi:GNAT family N-acetyltransferase [Kocuria sp. CNJ-770]|uniref:GNAT family N-acetyltransferase n=1 Tax=Kocuria sp. CNJ-770 TaxID=1904964 RepID=UPI002101C44A|nr:GNAT family N-acetyltransferase [Kocuria sp. CNJ-770]